jgi:magnesium-transporting ATPase (P-type)
VAEEKRKVTVLRNGIAMDIHEDYLLVGDIVNVVGGMEVYADGILLEASEVTADESAMTGEGDPIHKQVLATCIKKKDHFEKSGEKNLADKHMVPSPFLMSGTSILSGEGKMLILVVGSQSCIGKIRSLIQQDEP